MRISDLTPQEVRRYFESRLGSLFRGESVNQVVRCPFHQDRRASLSINLAKGVWKCFTGCGEGGLIAFEQKFAAHTSTQSALKAIFEGAGQQWEQPTGNEEEPEAIYSYTDARGKLLFQKLRYPGKRFVQRKVAEKGGWEYHLGTVKKPLYNLPDIITANHVFVVEGEKDADNVNRLEISALDKTGRARTVATTNFDGASSWDAGYARYFSGKDVAILPDFDKVGMKHAEMVAASVFDYALSVKIIELPGLAEHGDVSDYLQNHSALDLIGEVRKTPVWEPKKSALLVPAPEFLARSSEEIEWLVDGVIQRAANGFVVSDPKTGKSWTAVDLALALATGQKWMDLPVPGKAKVALITREDNPALTKWRMKRLMAGRGIYETELTDWLWINSRDQSPVFKLDVPEQLAEMMAALRPFQPDIVILDVLNVLHGAEENDSTEMRKVMDSADLISTELRCSVCVLHHFNKDQKNGRLTQRIRGSSAMAGWAEWVIGIHRQSEESEDSLRWMEFELKAGSPLPKRYFRIVSDDVAPRTEIVCEEAPVKGRRRGGDALA